MARPRNLPFSGVGAGGGAQGLNPRVLLSGNDAVHPSVAYLMLLVLIEYAALLALRYTFRNVHGG